MNNAIVLTITPMVAIRVIMFIALLLLFGKQISPGYIKWKVQAGYFFFLNRSVGFFIGSSSPLRAWSILSM